MDFITLASPLVLAWIIQCLFGFWKLLGIEVKPGIGNLFFAVCITVLTCVPIFGLIGVFEIDTYVNGCAWSFNRKQNLATAHTLRKKRIHNVALFLPVAMLGLLWCL